ncbi:spore germination cell wall hydrolase CwlJ-like protein [Sphingomonas sp. BE123]|uniref:cell wall hydrolase n=1 Tax=Sphingomonas sp. BE123 TaxID=2817842 RepID=UPI00285EF4ED|nr:cell wall hydrolase [Sphingomonas sp. BE123]MDR6852428.1 spore germination cell wall hydrolase CwlJ-like protein [Sphingomonas sp. BE123]
MIFSFRAALIAAATLTLAAGVGATAPGVAGEAEKTPVQALNEAAAEQVPTMADSLAALEADDAAAIPVDAVETTETARHASLADAVAAQDMVADDAELNCLAIGVYYESKGEPLEGQLAVAEVILNRARSGRFPASVCGVLTQRGQFSFVRGGRLPQPPAGARAWKTALAVAQVARADAWDSRVSDALFFHARYVSPGWRRARVGSVGNHIFYR